MPLSSSERQAERALQADASRYGVSTGTILHRAFISSNHSFGHSSNQWLSLRWLGAGYTSKQVTSDLRYKAQSAFRAAGLQDHPHARAAFASVTHHTRLQPCPFADLCLVCVQLPAPRVITQHLTTGQLAMAPSGA